MHYNVYEILLRLLMVRYRHARKKFYESFKRSDRGLVVCCRLRESESVYGTGAFNGKHVFSPEIQSRARS